MIGIDGERKRKSGKSVPSAQLDDDDDDDDDETILSTNNLNIVLSFQVFLSNSIFKLLLVMIYFQ